MTDAAARRPVPLTRSSTDRKVAGVCGGIAEQTGVDPTVVRLVVALLVLAGGLGAWVYAIAWFVIPPAAGESHADALLRSVRR